MQFGILIIFLGNNFNEIRDFYNISKYIFKMKFELSIKFSPKINEMKFGMIIIFLMNIGTLKYF
jgi:hypothetical protein